MEASAPPYRRWGSVLIYCYACCNCRAYLVPSAHHPSRSTSFAARGALSPPDSRPASTTFSQANCNSRKRRRRSHPLRISSVDVEAPAAESDADANIHNGRASSNNFLSWKDALPLSLYATICLAGAFVVSTYEDYDVTHTRPSPSTLRLPTSSERMGKHVNFLGAATRGMGWGPSDRGMGADGDGDFFEEWYGSSATTLQFKRSYNEIMEQHRSERVPRWTAVEGGGSSVGQRAISGMIARRNPTIAKTNAVASKEQLQRAVLQLIQSLDELDELKALADDYNWEEMKQRLDPTAAINDATTTERLPLPMVLEYSMDVLKAAPSGDLPELVGFDWGSCAWRHCGAKADAQEALAELHGSVGMLEPFECRFILDIVERSIRDVLAVVPEDLKPVKDGVVVQAKPYVPYVSQASANGDDEGTGIDYEYSQALSELRVDLNAID